MFQQYLGYLHRKLQDNAYKWIKEVSYAATQLAQEHDVSPRTAHIDSICLKYYIRDKMEVEFNT